MARSKLQWQDSKVSDALSDRLPRATRRTKHTVYTDLRELHTTAIRPHPGIGGDNGFLPARLGHSRAG
jgi:hypothetical protein